MQFKSFLRWIGAMVLVAMTAASAPGAAQATSILFILDGSGSMWAQVDGVTKIEIAKRVLGDLIRDLGPETRVGLMVYGHRSEAACDDIEVQSAIGAHEAEALVAQLEAIQPKGKTPIAGSLRAAKAEFTSSAGVNNNIVLISDGKETCEGDPCAVAGDLAREGIGIRVHVVGFDLTEEERAALACIAEQGKGRYVTASTSDELRTAITEVTKVAQLKPEPVPEPRRPEPAEWVEVFRDDFEGTDLAEHWEVRNPDPNMFIVENGNLLMVGKAVGNVGNLDSVPNVLRLNAPLPAGDWRATLTFSAELQTGRENIFMGLSGGTGNALMTRLWTQNDACCHRGSPGSAIWLTTDKVANGNGSTFTKLVQPRGTRDFQAYVAGVKMPIAIRLIKEGRTYWSEALFAGETNPDGSPKWQETEKVTSLRAPDEFVVGVSQWEESQGEGLFYIDSLVIEEKE